jgi:hypothetical protein
MSPVGGGYLAYQELPKYSDFNFTFPFSIVYDPLEDPDQTILNDLAEKCGLTGDEPTDLTIAYTIHVTAKVLFVSVHPTIDSQSTFPCPIQVSSNASTEYQECFTDSIFLCLLEQYRSLMNFEIKFFISDNQFDPIAQLTHNFFFFFFFSLFFSFL